MSKPAIPVCTERRSLIAALGLAAIPLALPRIARAGDALQKGARLRLAVVPQLTPVEMYRNWQPLVEALEQAGLPCELIIHPSIAMFEREFEQGTADVVFLNPYHMVMANRAHGYLPLLRDERPLEGLLLVLRDSPVQRVEDLQGQRISFPAPNALGASLYVRAMLARKGVAFDAHYASNHRNAIRQVLAGDSASAGVVRATYEMEPPEVSQAMRVLYATPAIAPHPLAAHPRVPVAVRQALTRTLLAFAREPQRLPMLTAIQMPKPTTADYVRDYAPLSHLGLGKYVIKQ